MVRLPYRKRQQVPRILSPRVSELQVNSWRCIWSAAVTTVSGTPWIDFHWQDLRLRSPRSFDRGYPALASGASGGCRRSCLPTQGRRRSCDLSCPLRSVGVPAVLGRRRGYAHVFMKTTRQPPLPFKNGTLVSIVLNDDIRSRRKASGFNTSFPQNGTRPRSLKQSFASTLPFCRQASRP